LDLWKQDPKSHVAHAALVKDTESPMWTRKYQGLAKEEKPGACDVAGKVMKLLEVDHMVIAHNPNSQREVSSRCGDTVHFIDAKLSRYMNRAKVRQSIRPAFLEILDMSKFVLHNPPSQQITTSVG